jgi:hypothetical protein
MQMQNKPWGAHSALEKIRSTWTQRGQIGAALLAVAFIWLHAPPSAAQVWQPSQAQAQTARAAVDAFLAAHDRGDAGAAYAMLSDRFKTFESETSFTRSVQAFREDSGPLMERAITRVTWYHNAPDAPQPGVYAAFDMVARFANIDRYCGYVVAYQPVANGPFTIMRIEQAFVLNAQARSLALNGVGPPLEEYWSQLASTACPGWRAANAP